MKKIIALALALALCLTVAACGKKDDTGAKIAAQKGTTSLMYAEALANITTASYDTFALAAKDMINGNADYLFVDKTTAKALQKEISGLKIIEIALSSENYGIGIDKNQADLKTKIDNILSEKATEIDAIKEKYMNGEEAKYVPVTSAAKNSGKAATQLVVATNAEFAPWEYKEGNKYYGIDMEIAQLIANELGMELVIDDMEFDAVVTSVGKNNIDIAMAGLSVTATRKESVNFSEVYYSGAYQVLVVLKENTEFDACKTKADVEAILKAK